MAETDFSASHDPAFMSRLGDEGNDDPMTRPESANAGAKPGAPH
jgi:hypothetical protein